MTGLEPKSILSYLELVVSFSPEVRPKYFPWVFPQKHRSFIHSLVFAKSSLRIGMALTSFMLASREGASEAACRSVPS